MKAFRARLLTGWSPLAYDMMFEWAAKYERWQDQIVKD
jgi:hypothetical protein